TLFRIPVFAQLINMNPDPDGPVWASGGLRAPVSSTSSYWNYIELIPTAASYGKPLPDFIYNDTLPYFSYIKTQEGNSCVQMSEVWYIYTYEINRKYGRTAANEGNDFTNLYK
ncbi:MAG TPA: hypothetical protein PKI35_08245, partial [Bacteroidales bacterium]|nr:hypothetical protein [Bacteroidales bacterium]